MTHPIIECLEENPVIAAIGDSKWQQALESPAQVIFYQSANLLTAAERVREAHAAGKFIVIHMDLAEGIGKDRSGLRYLSQLGVDGIISTKIQLIRQAKDLGLLTVQRFFALDSKGLESIEDMLRNSEPDLIEIVPGVIPKVLERFAKGNTPVIAGGLLETKAELTTALGCGVIAVSTGRTELWYM